MKRHLDLLPQERKFYENLGRVANGLSTITARLTASNDAYIASITGGMGTIDKNTGELRSTFDVLQDLSKAWENLTSVEKQELTQVVARQDAA